MIKRLILNNFKCFKNLDISLNNFSILVGENGTGKTSVLESLNLVLSAKTSLFLSSKLNEELFNVEDNSSFRIEAFFDTIVDVDLPDGYTKQSIPCKSIILEVTKRKKASPNKAISEPYSIKHYFLPNDNIEKTESGWQTKRKNGESFFKFTERLLSVNIAEPKSFPKLFLFDKNRERQSKIGFNSTLERLTEEFNWRFRKNFDQKKVDYKERINSLKDFIKENIDDEKLNTTLNLFIDKTKIFLGEDYSNLELSIYNYENPFSKGFLSLLKDLKHILQTQEVAIV